MLRRCSWPRWRPASRPPGPRPGDRSEAEIAVALRKELEAILQRPDMAADRKELDAAMAELRALIGKPAKPWWKFW